MLVMFPRPFITLFAVAAFGAWHGFAYAFAGILIACGGHLLRGAASSNRKVVRRIARGRLNRLSQVMRRRGLLAMTAVRLVPIAPFAVVNMVAGAIRMRLRHFMLGSALGILPGTLVATVFGDQLVAGLRDPRVHQSLARRRHRGSADCSRSPRGCVRRWLFADSPETHGSSRRPT